MIERHKRFGRPAPSHDDLAGDCAVIADHTAQDATGRTRRHESEPMTGLVKPGQH